jgi:two-component system chemotaxis response regulator CheV
MNTDISMGVMASVDQRTQLVGQNRMELLMFRLAGTQQLFGINVFKVREVTQCPKLTVIPNSHPVIRGIADFRGTAIPVIDFGLAVKGKAVQDLSRSFVIISEYNRAVQALIVQSVERIVNLSWNAIIPPPAGTRGVSGSYLTAVTQVEGKLVEIIDVERIIDEISPKSTVISQDIASMVDLQTSTKQVVLIADDSSVARNQIQKTLQQVGLECVVVNDGQQALDVLRHVVSSGKNVYEEFALLISDIEMPVMDGYTLTTEIRFDPKLKDLYIILHTSLSGVFNKALVDKAGANNFIAKFQPNFLAKEVLGIIEARKQGKINQGGIEK